ncbi:MAG: LPS-assembly protein LptD, partial [Gammaproteobacteria bacterium]|nr:LPS-assembly protein LptD [Gammaproteobacteria bacterium]
MIEQNQRLHAELEQAQFVHCSDIESAKQMLVQQAAQLQTDHRAMTAELEKVERECHKSSQRPSGPHANAPLGQRGSGGQSREVFDLEFEASTRFSRIFNVYRGGIQKIKHRIKPRLTYTYVSAAAQDHLPVYDFNDRVEHGEMIEYGLDNYFISKHGRGREDGENSREGF